MLCVSVSLWPFIALDKAQAANDKAELHQALLDLSNPWTVMCVAAHPDDEDGATLTVLRRKYGAHTLSLFSTFGEGGQNAIGPELYEDLGAIRARETLRASEIQGSEPHFLALKDFGFSKSADETFRLWGHDEALGRMVFKIRQLRPDVIITNHDTNRGHGHHQATGRLILEAFDAAADPKRFPEQLKNGVKVWQPQRLFVRFFNQGGTGERKPEEANRANQVIVVDPNERDAVRGSTYAEQALSALRQHASQGPWPSAVPASGASLIRYRLTREAKDAAPLPKGAQTLLEGLQLPDKSASLLTAPTIDGRPLTDFIEDRNRVVQSLIAAWKADENKHSTHTSEEPEARDIRMNGRLQEALVKAAGIKVSLKFDRPVLVKGTTNAFSVTVTNQGDKEVSVRHASIFGPGFDSSSKINLNMTGKLAPKATLNKASEFSTPPAARVNLPHAEHLYDDTVFGERYVVAVGFDIADLPFISAFDVKWMDVAPQIEFTSLTPSPYLFTPANLNRPLTFRARLVNHLNKPFKGKFVISNPAQSIHEVGPDIELAANETRDFTVRSNAIPVDTPDERRTPRADFGQIVFSVQLPDGQTRLAERAARVSYSDARVREGLRVGYVSSFDATLREALDALGVESKELTVEDVRAGDLGKYDTIIIDNRGYEAHPELIKSNARLLEFARGGGTLIVFYHKSNEWNPDEKKQRPQLAPLPIVLGNERVTDETAAVTFTEPQHPLLHVPNEITQDDFKNWIQERGLYYPKTWDAAYRAPFAMQDAGEEPLKGGVLTLDYGRGHYIYTSMVWYRQLRAGHPGGLRMFANMISYGTDAR